MFRKSKIKIVAAIMTLLILVLGGTFATIYVASYVEVTNENWTILNQYVENYSLPSSLSQLDDRNETQSWYNNTPMVQLSTFYTVVFTKDSQLLYVDTADIYTYNIDELVNLAQDVWDKGKSFGTYHNLLYEIAPMVLFRTMGVKLTFSCTKILRFRTIKLKRPLHRMREYMIFSMQSTL